MLRTPPVLRLPPRAAFDLRPGLPALALVGALGFMASLGLLLAACKGMDLGPCTAQQVVVDSTFHAYTDSGLPIASFALHQVFGGVPAPCSNEAPIQLAITSDAVAPLAFRYTLRGYDEKGGNAWIFLGAVTRLAPGDTIDQGTVARSRVRIDVNTRVGFDSVRVVP